MPDEEDTTEPEEAEQPKAAAEGVERPSGKAPAAKQSADFRHLVRIAETDLDGKLQAVIALARIRGIGPRTAAIVLDRIGVPRRHKVGDLSDKQIEALTAGLVGFVDATPEWLHNRRHDWATGDDLHLLSSAIPIYDRDDQNRMRKMRSYRGIRHEQGKKVRGQRTKSNGRKGLALGVIRAKLTPATTEEKKE